jgi:CRP-like cAMP-binding protein
VKDILWLRVLTVLAGMTLMPYFALRADPLWAAVAWNVLFIAINAYQIYLLALERRPVRLNEDEQRIYQLAFRSLTPREFQKLLGLGRWERAREGEVIVRKGEDLDRMMVIFSGNVDVTSGERRIVELGQGQFVGEMSFLTGERPTVDVVAKGEVRLVSWPKERLHVFLEQHGGLRAALQMILGADLVSKLRVA